MHGHLLLTAVYNLLILFEGKYKNGSSRAVFLNQCTVDLWCFLANQETFIISVEITITVKLEAKIA